MRYFDAGTAMFFREDIGEAASGSVEGVLVTEGEGVLVLVGVDDSVGV